MKRLSKPLLMAMGALVATGGLAAATSSSAGIVCNRFHECWHVHSTYTYPVAAGVTVYDDTWQAPTGYTWVKDRDDRGYWRHGHWHKF